MPAQPTPASPESALYRRVWRWHFYAGLVCLPFLALMALSGALYLYKEPIESQVYASLRSVPPTPGPALDAESLVARALAAEAGEAVRYVAPAQPGRSAEVGIRTARGSLTVYLDPAGGRVLGRLRDDRKLMEVVKHIHSLEIAGTAANHWIEVVAGWAIVLVVSGVFLWWPRGRSGGVYSVRGRPARRIWWRDLHAVTGVFAAAAILFLAVTGMPWSAFWGERFGELSNRWGVGLPKYLWGEKPESSPPLASLGEVPWTLSRAPLPQSGPHAEHAPTGSPAQAPAAGPAAPSIGLNEALRLFARLDLPAGTPVRLPRGPRGVYTATLFPDDVRAERVVHLDRYSGAVLADVGYRDYGIVGRLVEWGISLHTGRQFGWVNQLVMLAGCLSIVLLAVTAVAMWWKRRPRGRLAAPPRRPGDRAALGAIAVALLLGLLYPLLGASMLAALLIDAAVPQRWHERFGL
ncbi:PepSY-associated TM helix domain-containing protein [Chitinimonas koreensis]|uniref:PepSY-associated TM helix domain-containing protein n=1 Tax=Chitinimonas koreensis TaxID=356302 RepID=UPI0004084A77|nr:PepSY domain-containing protein [Chitinimonas koreensis]QNM95314.1 PepSY domain-containing protein [Chitinimonas koreensis]